MRCSLGPRVRRNQNESTENGQADDVPTHGPILTIRSRDATKNCVRDGTVARKLLESRPDGVASSFAEWRSDAFFGLAQSTHSTDSTDSTDSTHSTHFARPHHWARVEHGADD